jgi:hypothetical protein
MGWLDKLYVGLLLVIFGGIVLHAPLSVGLAVLFPAQDLFIKSWKEIAMGVAGLLLVVILTRRAAWRIFASRLFTALVALAALNIVLIPVYFSGIEATFAGLLINLRYLFFFVLVYADVRLYPQLYKAFITTFIAGAALVVGFAVLQTTVLPHDILKHIGYGPETIVPYLTVDENMDYVRINSTLRGPNPLGAYALIVIAVLLAAWFKGPRKLQRWELWGIVLVGAGATIALLASYSRSAALGAAIAIGIVMMVAFGRKITRPAWIAIAIVGLALCGSIVAFRETQFVSQVILHEDPLEGNDTNSNDGHAESLLDGITRMAQQPFGGGIGSTGSASLLSDTPVIIENQYLFVAHEVGWVGLVLFLYISFYILKMLWRNRQQWFALGVFASGVGLCVVGLVLPVWVDDTVAIVWWGLAGIAIAAVMPASVQPRKDVR